DWPIQTSTNGWTNDAIGFSWLEHFDMHTARCQIGSKRLLILDGHGSHTTAKFITHCRNQGIIPLCMPAHSSHLLQPLDLTVHGPLKKAYAALLDRRSRNTCSQVSKPEFINLFVQAEQLALTAKNIKSGFKAAGLVPIDVDIVIKRL